MDYSEYVKSLKRITLQDIKNIINDDIIKKKYSAFGFRYEKGLIFFGELLYGMIQEPCILMHENDENLCEELYNLLQSEFEDKCEYYYEHSFSGKYDYYSVINEGESTIYFPNYKQNHQSWIVNKVFDKTNKKI